MKLRGSIAILGACLVLGGCASSPSLEEGQNLTTSSDQTDSQKRANIRLQLAVGYYQQKQLPVALDEIKLALQADPNLADAYVMRGLIYMDMREMRLAEDSFQHALKLSPNNPEFNNNYGWFLCQNGQVKQALPYFDAALKNRTYQSPAKALSNAGVCSFRIKDFAAAERFLVEATRYDPANLAANGHLAKIYYGRGDFERARFYINRVIKTEMFDADALWQAIRIERKFGDREAEVSLVTQLRRRFPNSNEFALYQRGAFDE